MLPLTLAFVLGLSPADAGLPPAAPEKADPPTAHFILVGVAGLSDEDRTAVEQRQPMLQACARHLPPDATAQTFSLRVQIDDHGRAAVAFAPRSTWLQCLASSIRGVKFESGASRSGSVTFRLTFPGAEPISKAEAEDAKHYGRSAAAESKCLDAAARRLNRLAALAATVPIKERSGWRKKVAEARAEAAACHGLPLATPPAARTGSELVPDRCPGCKADPQ
jgi:hypothetical protein